MLYDIFSIIINFLPKTVLLFLYPDKRIYTMASKSYESRMAIPKDLLQFKWLNLSAKCYLKMEIINQNKRLSIESHCSISGSHTFTLKFLTEDNIYRRFPMLLREHIVVHFQDVETIPHYIISHCIHLKYKFSLSFHKYNNTHTHFIDQLKSRFYNYQINDREEINEYIYSGIGHGPTFSDNGIDIFTYKPNNKYKCIVGEINSNRDVLDDIKCIRKLFYDWI